MANFLVWVVWVVAAFACLASALAVVIVSQPVLLGARADREPRLARGALPAALGRVRRGRPGARLRRRGDGDVPVRDRLPRRPQRGLALVGRPVVADRRRGARRRRDPRRGHRRRSASRPAARSRARSHVDRVVRLAGVDREALPDRPPARVRGHVDRAARRRGRRRRARLARARRWRAMHGPDIHWYLVLSALLFATGALGVHAAPHAADHPALGRDHAQLRRTCS